MRTDERLEEETASPQHPGLMERLGHAVTARELHAIDRTIGLFQRWRNRIEPPAEEDDRRGGRHAARAETIPVAMPAAAAKHGRRRGFLIVVALLLAAGVAGMTFSYSLLRKTLKSDDMIIDDLRDQIAQLEKEDARKLSVQAKDQNQIAEQKKAIREYEAKVQDYDDQIGRLRQQIAALTPPPPQKRDTIATAGSRQTRAAQRAPQKTGNCVASGSTAAADLARCVEKFNQP